MARPRRASPNIFCTCARPLLQTAVAVRISSAKLLEGGGTGVDVRGAAGRAAGSAGSEAGAGAGAASTVASSGAGASSGTSRPFSGSIQTSAITLSCSFLSCSASRITKRVFQNGWSIHAPSSACRCMPRRTWSTRIFFSMRRAGGKDGCRRKAGAVLFSTRRTTTVVLKRQIQGSKGPGTAFQNAKTARRRFPWRPARRRAYLNLGCGTVRRSPGSVAR